MLQTTEKVRECNEHAVMARQRADQARAEWERDDWQDLEHGWRHLAQSYKFADRLEIGLVILIVVLTAALAVVTSLH